MCVLFFADDSKEISSLLKSIDEAVQRAIAEEKNVLEKIAARNILTNPELHFLNQSSWNMNEEDLLAIAGMTKWSSA